MEFSTRWHRLLRAAAFAGGLTVGLAGAVFAFSNVAPVSIHWLIPGSTRPVLDWTAHGVSLWMVGVLPLLVGLAAGYLYHLPARLHHLRQHLHHRQRVHELEHELGDLRHSMDRLVALPDDRVGTVADPAGPPLSSPASAVVLTLPESKPELAERRRPAVRPEVVKPAPPNALPPARPRASRQPHTSAH